MHWFRSKLVKGVPKYGDTIGAGSIGGHSKTDVNSHEFREVV